MENAVQIYDGKSLHYIDWLTEIRPSFTPPRRDIRTGEPGASEVYGQRLDSLNANYETLVQTLSQRLRTAIEVNGAEGLVSICCAVLSSASQLRARTFVQHQNYAETLQRPLKTYRLGLNLGGASADEPDKETLISYSKTE
jgi:dystonin